VAVELVQVDGSSLGISGDTDLLTLSNGKVTLSGDVGVTGSVAIATTTISSSYELYVAGSGYATGAFTSASDERFKENITPIESADAMEAIQFLQPVKFVFKTNQFQERRFAAGEQVGLLAQNVEKVMPELVTTDMDGYKSVAYDRIGVYLIKAMHEQQAQFATQDERLAVQQAQLAAQEARLVANASQIDALKSQLAAVQDLLCTLIPEATLFELCSTPMTW